MRRCFIISVLLSLALATASASAADNSSGASEVAHGGGLMCFSIAAARDGPPSCAAVCKAKGTVCVSLKMNMQRNPGIGCGDAVLSQEGGGVTVASCRCCALDH